MAMCFRQQQKSAPKQGHDGKIDADNSEEAGGGESTHRGNRREPGLEVQRGALTCVFNSEMILFRFVSGEQKKQLRGQECEGVGHSSPVESHG